MLSIRDPAADGQPTDHPLVRTPRVGSDCPNEQLVHVHWATTLIADDRSAAPVVLQ